MSSTDVQIVEPTGQMRLLLMAYGWLTNKSSGQTKTLFSSC